MSSLSRSRLPRRDASRERALSALGGGVRLKSEPVSGAPSPDGVAGAETVSVCCLTGDWSTLDRPSQYGCKNSINRSILQAWHVNLHGTLAQLSSCSAGDLLC